MISTRAQTGVNLVLRLFAVALHCCGRNNYILSYKRRTGNILSDCDIT